jgi:hypothetical protein
MPVKSLSQVVQERPFPEYAAWWQVGDYFSDFMSEAMVTEWISLHENSGDMSNVRRYVEEYLNVVYGPTGRAGLVGDFVARTFSEPLQSGEFDALSYAFYRSAFELIEQHSDQYDQDHEREWRLFTKRVGKHFFARVYEHLNLDLPDDLVSAEQVKQVSSCIDRVGAFLYEQGYLRSHFAFRFDVDINHQGRHITQAFGEVVNNLKEGGTAYALYEMGYPIILPSAVYLYHTIGEAQHHSSRTIEDLFKAVGYDARETDDFDPIGYPSEMVVELWEIKRKQAESSTR